MNLGWGMTVKTLKAKGLPDIDAATLFENMGERGIIFLDRGMDMYGRVIPGHYINYLKQADGSMLFLDAQWNKAFNSLDDLMRGGGFNNKFGLIKTK
ncbi:hypothetical protein [Bernardetia litoralis]|uniref:hypothetical protein n=1 Tax=Bernardetia litoralis TaxID=999 RepID=UPI0012FDFDE8|nr:hypothetical protein [Bernardetia litoralis]